MTGFIFPIQPIAQTHFFIFAVFSYNTVVDLNLDCSLGTDLRSALEEDSHARNLWPSDPQPHLSVQNEPVSSSDPERVP